MTMTTSAYEDLLEGSFLYEVQESLKKYHCLTERHIQVMWLEQKYFSQLRTEEGDLIEVISPGIWNGEGGPDFKKAQIRINNRDFYGDIELHLSDEGWTQHGHDCDPAYNNVVLHVSFWKSIKPKIIETFQKKSITKTYLEECATISPARIIQLVDLDLYPYRKCHGSGKCGETIFKTLSEEKSIGFFRSAAKWRLAQKRQVLQEWIPNEELRLAGGIALALGYRNNSMAFLDLFSWLQEHKDRSREELMAMALGAGGFFSLYYQQKWESSEYYRELYSLYCDLKKSVSLIEVKLVLSSVRPYSHPIRRIAYLIQLVKDKAVAFLFQRMEARWAAFWPMIGDEKELRGLYEQLIEMIPDYKDFFWNYHYTFEANAKSDYLSLIGDSLKKEILMNSFIPLLQETVLKRNRLREINAFNSFYGYISAQESGKAEYLKARFFGNSSKGEIFKKAEIVQGAYQLHRDFCVHYEASCEKCPFVERYLNMF